MTSKSTMQAATLANISNAFLLRGELDKAVVYARRSLAMDPDTPEIHFALANALDRLAPREIVDDLAPLDAEGDPAAPDAASHAEDR